MVNRSTIFYYYDEEYYNKLKVRQDKIVKNNYTLKEHSFIPKGSTVAV